MISFDPDAINQWHNVDGYGVNSNDSRKRSASILLRKSLDEVRNRFGVDSNSDRGLDWFKDNFVNQLRNQLPLLIQGRLLQGPSELLVLLRRSGESHVVVIRSL